MIIMQEKPDANLLDYQVWLFSNDQWLYHAAIILRVSSYPKMFTIIKLEHDLSRSLSIPDTVE